MTMNGHTGARPPRFDPYTGIHKGLRALLANSLLALGRLDTDNEAESNATIAQLVRTLDFCQAHAEHEDRYIHPAIEAQCPGMSGAMAFDHAHHAQTIDELRQAARGLITLLPAQRAAKALDLYRRMALFMAHTLEHLHHEETLHNAALWASHTDEEIEALHDELVASIEPAQALFAMRWMLSAMNPSERASLLRKLRDTAPPPVVDALLAAVREVFDVRTWAHLAVIASPRPGDAQASTPVAAEVAA